MSMRQLFSASSVWMDVQEADACYGGGGGGGGGGVMAGFGQTGYAPVDVPANTGGTMQDASGRCNVVAARAMRAVQAGLNALGYGPIPVNGAASSQTQSAWKRFLSDHKLAPGPGFGISQQGLILMEKLLKEGKTPGPGESIDYEIVGGEYIPTGEGLSAAGLGGAGVLLAVLVVAGLGYATISSGKTRRRASR